MPGMPQIVNYHPTLRIKQPQQTTTITATLDDWYPEDEIYKMLASTLRSNGRKVKTVGDIVEILKKNNKEDIQALRNRNIMIETIQDSKQSQTGIDWHHPV